MFSMGLTAIRTTSMFAIWKVNRFSRVGTRLVSIAEIAGAAWTKRFARKRGGDDDRGVVAHGGEDLDADLDRVRGHCQGVVLVAGQRGETEEALADDGRRGRGDLRQVVADQGEDELDRAVLREAQRATSSE
jgi:hypothetical protein